MFIDSEKTDIRRFCGYPAYGASPAGNMGWRFYTVYGLLEYRMQSLSAAEEVVVRGMLATLTGLERAYTGSGDSLDTERAGEWVRNSAEVSDRAGLFDNVRRRLCGFFGVPPGPALQCPGVVLTI